MLSPCSSRARALSDDLRPYMGEVQSPVPLALNASVVLACRDVDKRVNAVWLASDDDKFHERTISPSRSPVTPSS